MTVYIDRPRRYSGPRFWSHMSADTEIELDAMADMIGLKPEWRQPGHFDICSQAKRAEAKRLGSLQIGYRDMVVKCRALADAETPP